MNTSGMARPTRALVLNTGRCGSVTFAKACEHITNFTVGHETRCDELGDARLAFPDRHIEVDNRLAWFLGRMETTFGDNAVYVHLSRAPELVAESYNKRWTYWGSISMAYARGILKSQLMGYEPCRDYVRTVTENIELYLSDKTHVVHVDIAAPEDGFRAFWEAIGAEGDLEAALGEFTKRYNPSTTEEPRTVAAGASEVPSDERRALIEMQRILQQFEAERIELLTDRSRSTWMLTQLRTLAEAMGHDVSGLKDLPVAQQVDRLRTLDLGEIKNYRSKAEQLTETLEDFGVRERMLRGSVEALTGERNTLREDNEKRRTKLMAAEKTRDTAKAKLEELRYSLNFRLGTYLLKNVRNPIRWPLIPLGLYRERKAYYRDVAAGANRAKPENGKAGSARLRALYDAYELYQSDGLLKAETYIAENGTPDMRHAFELVRANEYLNEEDAWLRHVNAYLSAFEMAPLRLKGGDGTRFSRLGTPDLERYSDGPLVSVIMPAFDAEATIDVAAGSILDQTHRNLELIIVDDQSSDGTWAKLQALAARDSRVKVLRNAVNTGPYVAKNLGVQLARGKYITGHDADDWAHPQRLEKQVGFMSLNPDIEASVAHMLRVSEEGKFTHFGRVGSFSPDGAMRKAMISTIIDREAFVSKLGSWDCVRFGADSELANRAETKFKRGFVAQPLISMICLDVETSLTNHPEFGVSKASGRSTVRANYAEAFRAAHADMSPEEACYAFPPKARPFRAPPEMVVPQADIEQAAAALDR